MEPNMSMALEPGEDWWDRMQHEVTILRARLDAPTRDDPPLGAEVDVLLDDGSCRRTRTRSKPRQLEDGTWGVLLEGTDVGCALNRVTLAADTNRERALLARCQRLENELRWGFIIELMLKGRLAEYERGRQFEREPTQEQMEQVEREFVRGNVTQYHDIQAMVRAIICLRQDRDMWRQNARLYWSVLEQHGLGHSLRVRLAEPEEEMGP